MLAQKISGKWCDVGLFETQCIRYAAITECQHRVKKSKIVTARSR
jgi:hypothetical protein